MSNENREATMPAKPRMWKLAGNLRAPDLPAYASPAGQLGFGEVVEVIEAAPVLGLLEHVRKFGSNPGGSLWREIDTLLAACGRVSGDGSER